MTDNLLAPIVNALNLFYKTLKAFKLSKSQTDIFKNSAQTHMISNNQVKSSIHVSIQNIQGSGSTCQPTICISIRN